MVDFFRAGGFNMYVLAALGLVLIAIAFRFARNADAQRLSLIRALTIALVFASLTGFSAALAVTAKHVVERAPPEPLPMLLEGFAESSANLLLGGGIAVITWILVAVGIHRMPSNL
jgi:hypothetical protein